MCPERKRNIKEKMLSMDSKKKPKAKEVEKELAKVLAELLRK